MQPLLCQCECDGCKTETHGARRSPPGLVPRPAHPHPAHPHQPQPAAVPPPSTPLPPVPGPSRISGHESLLLLSASLARQSSRMSTASDITRPPSAAEPPHSPTIQPRTIAFSISEENMPTPRKHHANESISEIDVRDILNAVPDDDPPTDTDDILAALPKPAPRTPLPARKSKHTLSLADPIDPHTIPGGGSITRSFTFPSASSPSPRKTVFHDDKDDNDVPPRSPPSPDIGTILSKTPRPVLRSSGSRSRVSSTSSKASRPELRRRASEGVTSTRTRTASTRRNHPRVSDPTSTSRTTTPSELPYVTPYRNYGDSPYGIYGDEELEGQPAEQEDDDDDDTRSWIDHDEYGKPLVPPKKRRWEEGKRLAMERLERQLEGEGSESEEGSDSSLDLHTPLPHLMVRQGMLSPRSKLIAAPLIGARDSVASLASTTTMNSTTTKGSGLLKDSRDTEKRRARHKDGRLLRGGIGLTTGLGWSDSEDEDAPSALTRRLSALASTPSLSRMPSTASSARARSAVHPLSRSYSSGQLYDDGDGGDVDEWGARRPRAGQSEDTHAERARTPTRWSSHSLPSLKPRTGNANGNGGPPTSWGTRTRTKRSGSGSRASVASSAGSSVSVRGEMIPEGEEEEGGASGMGNNHMTPSPSTASSLSIPLPLTPQDGEALAVEEGKAAGGGGGGGGLGPVQLKREKSLPPLPPVLRRSPGSSNLGGLSAMQARKEQREQQALLSKSVGPGSRLPETTTRQRTISAGSAVRVARTSQEGGGGGAARVRTSQEGGAVRATTTPLGLTASAKSTPSAPTLMSSPRPLRLTQAPLLGNANANPPPSSTLPSPYLRPKSTTGDRPAVPVPSVAGGGGGAASFPYNLRARSPMPPPGGSLPSTPSTPGTPTTPAERPKPRTGTGMVYRSSGSGGGGSIGTRMRLPSTAAARQQAAGAGAGRGRGREREGRSGLGWRCDALYRAGANFRSFLCDTISLFIPGV
ncbi:hypothetical protein LshimejAT787_0706270 [Lyophyllum shimeji]|uniref:Uncharacterized protein n=1 Tax=Lyophyllum shimeji TaxID=47721 RepID=A0A9P3PP93_LYOSH|nr:hypothetical protein LshimejAT787_0706270 [Lyophyllum shimeji]